MATPLETYPQLASKIGLSGLYFKREDLHPYGSHKGRSIPVMIDHYYKNGDRSFAISSSGNSALAAALHIATLPDTKLDVFVGNHIAEHKLEKLHTAASSAGDSASARIRILRKERPLQALMQATHEGARSLRQSTDDLALVGYTSLAEELIEASAKAAIGAVFIGTSSGTTAQALAHYFGSKQSSIQVHIVQTSSCHPMTDGFDTYDGPDELSLADAIVDQVAHRKPKLIPLIEQTGGAGWVATNEDIEAAQQYARDYANLEISTNSALSVAGAMKAAYTGYEIDGAVVCMICGD
ncbi:MAG: PLP-dependent lyase/thiolase [Patescibacteria group bacterium]